MLQPQNSFDNLKRKANYIDLVFSYPIHLLCAEHVDFDAYRLATHTGLIRFGLKSVQIL